MYYGRRQATEYLRSKGLAIGDQYLTQQAGKGTGPLFRYSGKHPLYIESDLDDWIESRLGPPVRSRTEAVALRRSDTEARKTASANETALADNGQNIDEPTNPPLGPPTRHATSRRKRRRQKSAPTEATADLSA